MRTHLWSLSIDAAIFQDSAGLVAARNGNPRALSRSRYGLLISTNASLSLVRFSYWQPNIPPSFYAQHTNIIATRLQFSVPLLMMNFSVTPEVEESIGKGGQL